MSSDVDPRATLPLSDSWDPVEEERALAEVSAALFDIRTEPLALGRYVLLECIGRGGGGVVYRAYDPELDRRVAVKIVRPDAVLASGSMWTDRMRREAQAIAQLSHPNIVEVHDVGTIADGHPKLRPGLFIVMELIEGQTLAQWSRAQLRRWRDVLDVLMPIARALIAAHAAGLVHRDVKLGNVVIGSDGRPRLVDFGLARSVATEEASTALTAGGGESGTSALGTPSTMAPEQHLGRPADARTDQYGFCATLHAALHGGEYPFAGEDLPALLHAKQTRAPAVLRRDVPRWLTEAIARGLAADPAERFADMQTILEVLERGRGRTRRTATVAAFAGVVLLVAGLSRAADEPPPATTCIEQGDARIEQVWGPAARDTALAGLVASGDAQAVETGRAVDDSVVALLDRWRATRRDACTRAFAPGDEPSPARAARLACLDHVLDEVDELGALLRTADDTVARGAVRATRHLTPPQECEAAQEVAPTEPEIELVLRRARLQLRAGRFDTARTLIEQARSSARAVGDLRSVARAHLLSCQLAGDEGRGSEQERECEDAVVAAERAGVDQLTVQALVLLVDSLGARWDAELLYRLAEARLELLPEGWKTVGLRASLAFSLGRIRQEQHRYADAGVALDEALRLTEQAYGVDDPDLVAILNALGILRVHDGQLSLARDAYARALEITRRAFGQQHPNLAILKNNLAGIELMRGRPQAALTMLEDALAIKLAAVGPNSPRLPTTLQRIARAQLALDRSDLAIAPAERALALTQAAVGPLDDRRATALLVVAIVRHAQGRCDDALVLLDEAARIHAVKSPDHTDAAELLLVRGRCLVQRGDDEDGRFALQAAVETAQSLYGAASRHLVEPLLDLAAWHARHDDTAAARRLLDSAQRICAQTEGDPRHAARVTAALSALR